MKKINFLVLFTLVLLASACGGESSTSQMTLNSPDGIVAIQNLIKDKFSKYDGKITAVNITCDQSYIPETISVDYKDGDKIKSAIYTEYTDVVESENGTPANVNAFSVSDIDLTKLTDNLIKASEKVLEKDKEFSDFGIENLTFKKNDKGELETLYYLHANHPGKPYFGKRVSAAHTFFEFIVVMDKDGNVVSISDLEI